MTRTNHTIEHLTERINYFTKQLNERPQYAAYISKDLEDAKLNLEDALTREYIGQDETGAKAYIYDGFVYVEGKPSGFAAERFTKGKYQVCYDGGTRWFGILTIF